ncbi:MAG: zinc ribbon domain-containing protein [Sumerlaeia bacterium]
MKTLHLTCNHCGAPLDVAENANFVTCGHCGSRLKIERTESSYSTSVLESIDRRTQDIQEDIEVLHLQNDLERLDREWEHERESLLMYDKHGRAHEPSKATTIAQAIFGVVFLVVAFTLVTGGNAFRTFGSALPSMLFMVVAAIVVLGLVAGLFRSFGKAGHYATRQSDYHARRHRLLAQMERKRRRGSRP